MDSLGAEGPRQTDGDCRYRHMQTPRTARRLVNVVCLIGSLGDGPESDAPERPGWQRKVLKVPRRLPFGAEDAGVMSVIVLLPHELGARARFHGGESVAVVGMLHVETDYSTPTPTVDYAVIAETIEPTRPFVTGDPSTAQPPHSDRP